MEEVIPAISIYATDIQTYAEELLNVLTHAIGLLMAIPAVAMLILLAKHHGNMWHVIASAAYGGTLILMYVCSTVYHISGIAQFSPYTIAMLKTLDHCAIYFLIAGTYTPLVLINLIHNIKYASGDEKRKKQLKREAWTAFIGWSILITVWTGCFIGVTLKLKFGSEGLPPFLSYGLYLILGWAGSFALVPLIRNMPRAGLKFLLTGGIAYTIGMIFLLSDRIPFNHPVWHLFVSAGSILHFLCVLASIIPFAKREISSWKAMEKRGSRPPLGVERVSNWLKSANLV